MSAATYRVDLQTDAAQALCCWRKMVDEGGRSSLFQTAGWLQAWYATLGKEAGRTPLLVTVQRNADGAMLMALPLSIQSDGRLRRVTFADAGVADYAAPLLMPDCPDDAHQARAMFTAIRQALPHADLLTFEKMPATLNGRGNPLRHIEGLRDSSLSGNPAIIGEDFEAWRFSREKTHRKELERCWRVFVRHPEARFERITEPHRALKIMDTLEAYQRDAICNKGWAYILDEPGYRAFYRQLITDGLHSGDVVLTALFAGDEVIAALLGLRHGNDYAMIRIGSASGPWRNCSPGRLIIERSMACLHADGVRCFDFTIGDYSYKKGFMPGQLPLFDLTLALSWRGWPRSQQTALRYRFKQHLATRPRLRQRLQAIKTAVSKKAAP